MPEKIATDPARVRDARVRVSASEAKPRSP
jgi:hypothetical protein